MLFRIKPRVIFILPPNCNYLKNRIEMKTTYISLDQNSLPLEFLDTENVDGHTEGIGPLSVENLHRFNQEHGGTKRSKSRAKSSLDTYSISSIHSGDMSLDISTASGGRKKLRLTPRSRLACRMQGVLLHELLYRPLSYFEETGLLPEQVNLRYQHYEEMRNSKLFYCASSATTWILIN